MTVGRDDRTETVGTFAVTGKAMQTGADKGTCKHCGKFVCEESDCHEPIGYPSSS